MARPVEITQAEQYRSLLNFAVGERYNMELLDAMAELGILESHSRDKQMETWKYRFIDGSSILVSFFVRGRRKSENGIIGHLYTVALSDTIGGHNG